MNKLVLILAIILIAGCTGNNHTESQPNQGIIIKSLEIKPSEVVDIEPFDLLFEVTNVGGKKTTVNAYIYGPSWISDTDGNLGGHELIAPDKQVGSIGESFIYTETYEPPVSVTKGLTQEYIVNGRICYPYTTSAVADVEIISIAEKRITEVKQATKTVKTQNSDAPIRIEFTIKEPLIDYGNGQEIPIAVKIRDVGGGFAATSTAGCKKNPALDVMNKLDVTLTGEGINTCVGEDLHLINGETTLFCKIVATTEGVPSKNVKLIAEATYNYYKTKTTTVKISGIS
ncbi:MAG: hypothetical protein KAI53_01785 [Candidatus Aenigmarchaeota archaeon]|nr:hypothetical protein [Candidatus Aenigmarchaeota archaeon]